MNTGEAFSKHVYLFIYESVEFLGMAEFMHLMAASKGWVLLCITHAYLELRLIEGNDRSMTYKLRIASIEDCC